MTGPATSWAAQLSNVSHKRRTLSRKDYVNVDWEKELDLQRFVGQCSEMDPCYLEKLRRNNKWKSVPVLCNKHMVGTNWWWRMQEAAIAERYRKRDEAEEKAKEEAKALTERARLENPDLHRQDMLWLPLEPGVAIIRGDLLADVAKFFPECDILVEEHNEPTTNRSLKARGEVIARINEEGDYLHFTDWSVQVRLRIVKFRQPVDSMEVVDPGDAALVGLKGAHGSAMCGLIFFLGTTGGPGPGRTDEQCSYWFYSAWGISPDVEISKLGDKPFRMVRLPNAPVPHIPDVMMRFDLKGGKKRTQSFYDNFYKNVMPWKVTPRLFKDFYWGSLRHVRAVSDVEDDDFGEDDSCEDDPREDENAQDDEVHDDEVQDDELQDDEVQDNRAQDNISEISELTNLPPTPPDPSEGREESRSQPGVGIVPQKERSDQDESTKGTNSEEEAEAGERPVIFVPSAQSSDEPPDELYDEEITDSRPETMEEEESQAPATNGLASEEGKASARQSAISASSNESLYDHESDPASGATIDRSEEDDSGDENLRRVLMRIPEKFWNGGKS